MPDDFSKLGADGFESLSQALALCVLGPGLKVFGDGPDGGREATFDGPVPFPDPQHPWDGHGVLQAKYKARPGTTQADNRWFLGRVKAELEDWANPAKRRVSYGQRPQYLVFTTNISLSSTPGTGSKDAFDRLMAEYQDRIGLLGWRVWDAEQISRLLDRYPAVRTSYAGLITPSEVIAELLKQLTNPIAVNVASPTVTVNVDARERTIRPGEPGNEAAFQTTVDAVGGADLLGDPRALVEQIGDGYVQPFDGGLTRVERILCAPAGYPVVAMDRMVWDQIQAVGGRRGGVEHIGFPLAPATGRPYIGPDWTEILLVGGDWGRPFRDERRGRLVRRCDGSAVWQPDIVFDDEASRTRGWRVDSRTDAIMDLRLAVSGHVLIRGDDLQITDDGRERMLDAVARSGLDDFLLVLRQRYGGRSRSGWSEVDEEFRNTGQQATYEYLVAGPDGRTAIRAGLQIALPTSYSVDAAVMAEVRIDFDAIRPSTTTANGYTPVPGDLAVTFDEILAFLEAGWSVCTSGLLVTASTDPLSLVPAGASRIEFYIENERPVNMGDPRPRQLLEMVDLAQLGRARVRTARALAVGITSPIGLTRQQIEPFAADALDHLGRSFGFARAGNRGRR
ncbi:hypothetical protein [Nucisporomicrobium flavum]|uniref:hypothetical protein n=1 Tax=Nucisporomicrobium flavum TaxID=2785915 RepID=UPI0018F6245D|nr:hypothetical protein [Nucisporomicrobium flavum]